MRYINKSNPPQSLINHLVTPNHTYNNYAEKDDLRKSLLAEQGYLCCYCMQRIQRPTADKMKIEHFKPQNNTNRDLDYKNLLGACKGNEGGPHHLQHCDTIKANQEISLNPLDKNLMTNIKFSSIGEVFVENGIQNNEINKVLNLNLSFFKRERKAILDGLKQKINQKFGKSLPTVSYINEELKLWKKERRNKNENYCEVAIYYLNKELKRAV